MIRAPLRRFGRSRDGAVAVEFAWIGPVLLAVFFGGYSVSQCVAVSRKVTITTRALADLTTQFATMSSTDMTTVLNASSQIIAPFDPSPLSLRLTEITTDVTGLFPTVTWCATLNMTAYKTGSTFTLPTAMLKPNTSYIYSETQYIYQPFTIIGGTAITMSDRLYMLPRISSSISYSG